MTVKCVSEEDAKKLESTLKTHYGSKIEITQIKDTYPKFKIIGAHLNDISNQQFILNLKEQNDWLKNADLQIVDKYDVPGRNGTYSNVIVRCDVQTLKRVLEKGQIILGLDMKKVYEYIDILQCFRCQKYGHVATVCMSDPACKFFGHDHESRLCGEKEEFTCINCIRQNRKGANLNAKHKATDERCPMRNERIAGLKEYATKN